MADVIVAGAGPTGMMLGAELALAGLEVTLVERRPTAELIGSRAGGFHSRTIELLDQRGVADRFISAGQIHRDALGPMFGVSDFPTRHPYTLGLWQNRIEEILAGWIAELGVRVVHGREVAGFTQTESGVEVRYADSHREDAAYLIGADGGRSLIRKLAGIEFPGAEATRTALIAEVELGEEPPAGPLQDSSGVHGLTPLEDGRTFRVVTAEAEPGDSTEPTLGEVSASLRRAFGTDFAVHHPTWISRFSDATRQAASYRNRRVLLAGDAAHVHFPAGGQGIGLGIQDAVNLGWKLGQVVRGQSPDSLLDTYQAERHPATARVLDQTMVLGLLQRPEPRAAAVKRLFEVFSGMSEPRRYVAGLLSGLDTHYDLGEGHPLLGRAMRDLELGVGERRVRVFELLHEARPVLLRFGCAPAEAAGVRLPESAPGRVRTVEASYDGPWELPVLGAVTAPTSVLIRPDGYVAWVGERSESGLAEALTRWFPQDTL